MSRLLRSFRLVGTIAAEAVLVGGLATLGRRPGFAIPIAHPVPWLRDGDPATVTVAVLRWFALAGAVWLLLSTVLYALAALSGIPAAVRAVRWSTLPAVRRAVDAACAVSVATTVALAPVAAGATGAGRATGRPGGPAADPPSVSLVRDGHADGSLARLPADDSPTSTLPTSTLPTSTLPTTTPPPTPPPTPTPAAVSAVPPSPALPNEVVVVDGDNLWTIATVRVAAATGRSPETVPDAEVAPYWALVCATNRPRLASGDPNLVYPGEHVVLPPVIPR